MNLFNPSTASNVYIDFNSIISFILLFSNIAKSILEFIPLTLYSLATIEFFNSTCSLYAILSLITNSFLLVNERYANSFSPNESLLSCITFTNSSIINTILPPYLIMN